MLTSHRLRSMRMPLLSAALTGAVTAAVIGVHPASATASASATVSPAGIDRFVVRFKEGTAERGNATVRQRRLDALGHAQGLQVAHLRRLALGADVIRTRQPLTVVDAKAFVAGLRNDPRVEYAEVDVRMQPQLQPNDPEYGGQWHFYFSAGISVQNAWDLANGAGQVVAVLDTGITAHPDLDGNRLPGYDFITDLPTAVDGDGRDSDASDPGDWFAAGECGAAPASNSSWHGTHVAGLVAAVTNNGIGTAGTAHGAKFVPVRVLGKCGGWMSDVADGIVWAAGGTVGSIPDNPHPADVINLSFAGSGACSTTFQEAIDSATAGGALVVASAGNGNVSTDAVQPANCDGVVAVAATTRSGERAGYSNYGASVDLAAPGGDATGSSTGILSTRNGGATTPASPAYGRAIGTSRSAAQVSGVAALAREASGNTLSPAEVTAILQGTARSLSFPCVLGCGAGRVDATAAVMAAMMPIVTVADAPSVDEGSSGSTTRQFQVRLSEAIESDVTFDWYTVDGTAVAGADYVASVGTGTIPAGATTAMLDVSVFGDTVGEGDEDFFIQLENVAGSTVVDAVGSTTLFNDDTLPLDNAATVYVADPTPLHDRHFTLEVPVGASNLKFHTNGPSGDADLYVDFEAVPTESSYLCRSNLPDSNESCSVPTQPGTWHVMVDAFSPYERLGLVGSYEIPVELSISDLTVSEGPGSLKFITVSISQRTGADVRFQLTASDGSAVNNVDYRLLDTYGSVYAGTLSSELRVAVFNDAVIEADEDFFVDLAIDGTGGAATITDGQAKVTIVNDDLPTLSIDDQGIVEDDSGQKLQTFEVTLSPAVAGAVTFDVAAVSGSAVAGEDFEPTSHTGVVFNGGETKQYIVVPVYGDTDIEGDETYTVALANANGATIVDGSGIGTISNDDFPTLSIGDASVAEGNSGTATLTYTVTLSQVVPFAVGFDAASVDGTASSTSDYVAASVTGQEIPAGQLAKTFSVTVNGDGAMERHETVLANIDNAVGASIADGQATGTITNDDGTLSVANAAVTEGNSGTKVLSFVVSLSQASTAPVTYDIATANNTATAGSDYVASALAGETIPAGQLSRTFGVTIHGDTTIEPNEILRANVSSDSVVVADAQGTGTIVDDDGILLSIADAGFVEGNSGSRALGFIVSLSRASGAPVTYNITTNNGTATAGSDYVANTLTGQSIPAGQLTKTFFVTVNGDTTVEGNETFFVNLSNTSVSASDAQAKATITNDDGPVLSISDAQLTEADSGSTQMTFTVSLSQVAPAPVSFNFSTANGTALAGPDFVPVTYTGLKIPTGQLSKTVVVFIKGDLVVEPNETLVGNISMGNVSIKDGVGIGTIINDD